MCRPPTRVLPSGTAYISDVGMTGPRDSVIGFSLGDGPAPLHGTCRRASHVAEGPVSMNAVVVTVDPPPGVPARSSRSSASSTSRHGDEVSVARHRRSDRLRQDRARAGAGGPHSGRDPRRRFATGVSRHGCRHRQARPRARASVPHHSWTCARPTEPFTVAQWVARARELIPLNRRARAAHAPGGGNGLYIAALVEGANDYAGQAWDPQPARARPPRRSRPVAASSRWSTASPPSRRRWRPVSTRGTRAGVEPRALESSGRGTARPQPHIGPRS